jgi:hypothetical protein
MRRRKMYVPWMAEDKSWEHRNTILVNIGPISRGGMIVMRQNKRIRATLPVVASVVGHLGTREKTFAPVINSRRSEWDMIELSKAGVSTLMCTCITATSRVPNESPSHRILEQ